jgi:spore germination protein YaaH
MYDSIPEIPSDDPVNGLNYYRLLSSLKSSVGSSKTVSFAAPASYWYLKSFPIKDMANALDYIIYMTYDLHGQWVMVTSGPRLVVSVEIVYDPMSMRLRPRTPSP